MSIITLKFHDVVYIMNNLEYNRFTLNMYDIFANFLPGFVLVGGLLLPFAGHERIVNAGLLEGVFATLAAFAVGGFTQAIGSKIKRLQFRIPFCKYPSEDTTVGLCIPFVERRTMPFHRKMSDITENCEGILESEFSESCEELLKIDSIGNAEEDWDSLFKTCLAFLEVSPCNRTLRIQAQHLATRGLYIAFFFLFSYYLLLTVILYFNGSMVISPQKTSFPISVLALFSIFSVGSSYLAYIRSTHFENDVTEYMISEIYISSQIWEED